MRTYKVMLEISAENKSDAVELLNDYRPFMGGSVTAKYDEHHGVYLEGNKLVIVSPIGTFQISGKKELKITMPIVKDLRFGKAKMEKLQLTYWTQD